MNNLLALGANLPSIWGSPARTISKAIEDLSERIGEKVRIAPYYTSPAFPAGSGPDFVNTVIAVETEKNPQELLEICHEIESDAHRLRDNRWAPRTLDIDLIACGEIVAPSAAVFESWRTLPMDEQTRRAPSELILPHPRLQDRAFVLVPLNDIAPDWRHPILGQTTAELLAALPTAEKTALKRLDHL